MFGRTSPTFKLTCFLSVTVKVNTSDYFEIFFTLVSLISEVFHINSITNSLPGRSCFKEDTIIWPSWTKWIQQPQLWFFHSMQLRSQVKLKHPHVRVGLAYLNDAAPAGGCLHRIQEDGVSVLSATGEDHAASPTAGRSRRDAVRRSVAAQPLSVSITLRHVDEEGGSIWNTGMEKLLSPPDLTRVKFDLAVRWCHLKQKWVLALPKHQPLSSSPAALSHRRKPSAPIPLIMNRLSSSLSTKRREIIHPNSAERLTAEIGASHAGSLPTWMKTAGALPGCAQQVFRAPTLDVLEAFSDQYVRETSQSFSAWPKTINEMVWEEKTVWKQFSLSYRATRNPAPFSQKHIDGKVQNGANLRRCWRQESEDSLTVTAERFARTTLSCGARLGLTQCNKSRLLTRIANTIDSRFAPPPTRHPSLHSSTQLLPQTGGTHDWRTSRPMRSAAGRFGRSERRW